MRSFKRKCQIYEQQERKIDHNIDNITIDKIIIIVEKSKSRTKYLRENLGFT